MDNFHRTSIWTILAVTKSACTYTVRTDFSTTGTLQSFQSSDDVNNHHERLGKQMSWDEEEGERQHGDGGDHVDTVSLAQAFQDPEFFKYLIRG